MDHLIFMEEQGVLQFLPFPLKVLVLLLPPIRRLQILHLSPEMGNRFTDPLLFFHRQERIFGNLSEIDRQGIRFPGKFYLLLPIPPSFFTKRPFDSLGILLFSHKIHIPLLI